MTRNPPARANTRTRWSILIWVVALSLLLAACGGTGQPKSYTIGVAIETKGLVDLFTNFKAAMTDLGYVEGKNITYINHDELGTDLQKNEAEIKSLIDQKIDLLLTMGTAPAKAAKKLVEGTDLPMVFVPVVNPVEEGIVASISHPGGNVTGVQSLNIAPKALEWLLKVAPGTKQIYVPYSAADQVALTSIKPLPDVAAQLGITLKLDAVTSSAAEMAAIKALPKDSAIFFLISPSLNASLGDMKKLAIELGIPTGSRSSDTTDVVVSYTTDTIAQAKQAAVMADKILKGAKPADLPVETPEFFLIINLKTAKAIGLNTPDAILSQANTVIR